MDFDPPLLKSVDHFAIDTMSLDDSAVKKVGHEVHIFHQSYS